MPDKDAPKLKWNVFIGDFNAKVIKTHNVFDHRRIIEDCRENYKRNKENREEFCEQLRKDLQYAFWSKCEWEIIISHWPPRESAQDLKIDVFDQVMLNWPIFSEYVWENRDEFKVRRKRKA